MDIFKRNLILAESGILTCLAIGFLLIASPYASIASNLEDYFIFLQDNKKGVRNADHEIVIPAEYDDLGWSLGEFHPVGQVVGYMEDNLWGLITLENQRISNAKYQSLYPLNQQLILATMQDPLQNQEIYGIIDLEGNIVLDFEYGWLSMFNNMIVASKKVGSAWRFGMMDQSYQVILPFEYDQIKTLNNRFAVIMRADRSGLIDASGQIVVAPEYHEIELKGDFFRGKLFDRYEIKNEENQLLSTHQVSRLESVSKGVIVTTGVNESHLISPNGKVLTTHKDVEILEFKGDWATIKKNGLFGLVDVEGREIVNPSHRFIWITEKFAGIQQTDGNWALLDRNLKTISTRRYQALNPGSEGLFAVKRQDSWGFVNRKGEEVIPPQYQQVSDFANNQAFANYLGSWGIISPLGNWLVKPRFDILKKINPDTYWFKLGQDQGLVSTKQGIVYQTSNQLLATKTGALEKNAEGLYSLISLQGEQMLSMNYSAIEPFDEDPNYYRFKDDQGLGIFNISERKFFRDTAIQEIRTLDEGYIGIKINDQYGFIDLNGKLRIANRYQDVGVFNEDMLPVKIRGRWGYVDRIERLKVQPLYERAGHFINGLAIVSVKNKYGLINNSGTKVLKLEYDRIDRLPDGNFICYQGRRSGLVDVNGQVLLYPSYQSLETLENGHLKISKNGKLGIITSRGKTLIPASYDEITYDAFNDLYILTKEFPWKEIKISDL